MGGMKCPLVLMHRPLPDMGGGGVPILGKRAQNTGLEVGASFVLPRHLRLEASADMVYLEVHGTC